MVTDNDKEIEAILKELEGYKIEIVTRSMNKYLYNKSQSTINLPYKRTRLTRSKGDTYLYRLIKRKADYIINIDEDAFVTDNTRLIKLLKYCIENDIDACGPPDGGVLNERRHNPLSINPFFTIFNAKKLRKHFKTERRFKLKKFRFVLQAKMLDKYRTHKKEYEAKTPFHLIKPDIEYFYDNYEPYYPFFIWINQNFKVLYLDAEIHSDNISTILLDHENKPFITHTWFTREYGKDTRHTERINNVINSIVK